MAYSLANRFEKPPECNTLLDPGAYQYPTKTVKPNKAPFLSKTPRKTATAATIWTHSIYNAAVPPNIPGCASLKSKTPRFPYESFGEKDLEEFLCRCGFPNICECSTEEEEEQEIICQGNIRRRLFKAPPHSTLGVGISAPSKSHRGFDIMPDGSVKQILEKIGEECPPFYDARVNEATAFYHGWKWSQWKSKRTMTSDEVKPGPADYDIEKKPKQYEICIEKFRERKRKTSKQLRYIEMVQRRHIIDSFPGPATYNPELPKGTNLQFLGPKAARFSIPKHEVWPSPMSHNIKRAFDLPEAPECICYTKLPVPAVFGTKAPRFNRSFAETPGPATYSPKIKVGGFINCSKAPFGCSAIRFKNKPTIDDDALDGDYDYIMENKDENNVKTCPPLTWMFRSRTLRTKPLIKQFNSPSPADFPQPNIKQSRSFYLQQVAPFSSSEGRFRPWNDWMPVHGKLRTPGPCQYNLEKPKCLSAVRWGPLYRARRFVDNRDPTPAPNEYTIGGGLENILKTHNKRLKNNIENQYRFKWEPSVGPEPLTYKEQELLLIKNTIELLDPERSSVISTATTKERKSKESVSPNKEKEKLLRCFLYEQSLPRYF